MSKFFNRKINSKETFLGQPRNLSGVSAKIDYKNVVLLRNFITFQGKIVPRRVSKLSAKQQRYMSRAIKNARIMGLLPFINKQRPMGLVAPKGLLKLNLAKGRAAGPSPLG